MQQLATSDEQAQAQASTQHRLNYQSILKKLKKQLLQHQSNNITSNNMTIAFFGGGEEGRNEVETQNIEEYKKNQMRYQRLKEEYFATRNGTDEANVLAAVCSPAAVDAEQVPVAPELQSLA